MNDPAICNQAADFHQSQRDRRVAEDMALIRRAFIAETAPRLVAAILSTRSPSDLCLDGCIQVGIVAAGKLHDALSELK